MRVSRPVLLTFFASILVLVACQTLPGGRTLSGDAPAVLDPPAPPPPTAGPGQLGLPGTRLVWEWGEDARPSIGDVAQACLTQKGDRKTGM